MSRIVSYTKTFERAHRRRSTERAELDRRLPSKVVKLPFPLAEEQIESYQRLYRYYPLLAEVDL